MHAPRTFYCHESRPSRRAATRTFPRAIRKIASSRLSAATQLPFAHEMALPSSICTEPAPYASVKPSPHKSTGELMYTQYLVSFD